MVNLLDVLVIQNVNILKNNKSIKKGQGHIMPCNTKIINHHVYRHTYQPEYTYCEENVCENIYDSGCC